MSDLFLQLQPQYAFDNLIIVKCLVVKSARVMFKDDLAPENNSMYRGY